MLLFLAAALSGAAGGADVTNLPGVFQATCLDGQAKLRADEVSAITFNQLPPALQESLGRPTSGKVWKLNSSGSSYLYMLDYAAAPGVSPKVCGLASDTMDAKTAGDMLEQRVTGGIGHNRAGTAQWINAQDGYVATATMASTFKVLQISWMSDADKATAQAQVAQLPH